MKVKVEMTIETNHAMSVSFPTWSGIHAFASFVVAKKEVPTMELVV